MKKLKNSYAKHFALVVALTSLGAFSGVLMRALRVNH
ncbi:MAG: hypothetical protein JWN41_1473 [Thermoleophilia bacterium]|nr:hypothetical protein [Thermoleophilia bacterium]